MRDARRMRCPIPGPLFKSSPLSRFSKLRKPTSSRFAPQLVAAVSIALGLGAASAADTPTHARLVAPGVISTGDYDSHAAFTPDARTLYFLRLAPDFSRWTIFVSHLANGRWSSPAVAPFSGQWQDADPSITADGRHLYFVSDRPIEPGGARRPDHDIWMMDRTATGWSAPRHLPAPVNSDADEWYPIALANGALYFGSQRTGSAGGGDIYRAHADASGTYTIEQLGPPVNTSAAEYEAFVTEDEQTMLLTITRRPDSLGDFDLYVSHKEAGGAWGAPVNLGPEVNSPARELSPKLTPDGHSLIWTSCRVPGLPAHPGPRSTADVLRELHSPGNGLGDIYEIDVASVPALKRSRANQAREPASSL